MFHQMEGLAVDEGITLGDLKGTLLEFARAMFGREREVRLRSGFFPFTEPSVEVDVSCFQLRRLRHAAATAAATPLCKGTGWIEILGSGMVDPNVYGFVAEQGYDPERVPASRSAWASTGSRCCKHGVHDLRAFFENDLRFLEQFR